MSLVRRSYIAVAVGGAVGAWARSLLIEAWPASDFPWGVFVVNTVGSGLLAFVLVWGERSLTTHPRWRHLWRPFMATGVLGGFTTTSAFAVLSLELWRNGRTAAALGFVLGSIAAALLAHIAVHSLTLRLLPRSEEM